MRYTQPQSGPVRVDPSIGSDFSWIASVGKIVGPNVSTSTASRTITKSGIAINSGYAIVAAPIPSLYGTTWTECGTVLLDGSNQVLTISARNDGHVIDFNPSVNQVSIILWGVTSINFSLVLPIGITNYVARRVGNNYAVWINGSLCGSTSYTATSTQSTGVLPSIGSEAGSGTNIGVLPLFTTTGVLSVTRTPIGLSDAKCKSISSNTWQLFDDPKRVMLSAIVPANVGAIAWLEQNDVSVINENSTAIGSASWNESSDISHIAASSAISVDANWHESSDLASISAFNSISALAGWHEASDITSIISIAQNNCTESWCESNDIAAMSANVSGTIGVLAAWAEVSDVASLNASESVIGSPAWTESIDISTISAIIGEVIIASASWSESLDMAGIAASAQVGASASWSELPDSAFIYAAIQIPDASVRLQQKIYSGYAKAAMRIGSTFAVYRPSSSNDPIAPPNIVASLPASFNAMDMKYGKPNLYGKPMWYALVDGTQTRVGDYLIYGSQTYFIVAQQLMLPILAVECNRIVSVLRPYQVSGIGAQGYAGNTAASETLLMQGWPASILQGTKGESNDVNLPGDVRNPWWQILFPAWPGVALRTGDIITDDLIRRYVISSAESTDFGWRITAMQAQT